MRRIGVFVCHCGSNIAATVDVKKVVEMALQEQGTLSITEYRRAEEKLSRQYLALKKRDSV